MLTRTRLVNESVLLTLVVGCDDAEEEDSGSGLRLCVFVRLATFAAGGPPSSIWCALAFDADDDAFDDSRCRPFWVEGTSCVHESIFLTMDSKAAF